MCAVNAFISVSDLSWRLLTSGRGDCESTGLVQRNLIPVELGEWDAGYFVSTDARTVYLAPLPPPTHTHKPVLNCFGILYVPYPWFGIFIKCPFLRQVHPLLDLHINLRWNLCAVGSSAKKSAGFVIVVAARNCVKSVRYQTCCHALSRLVCILTITWLRSWPEPICRFFF